MQSRRAKTVPRRCGRTLRRRSSWVFGQSRSSQRPNRLTTIASIVSRCETINHATVRTMPTTITTQAAVTASPRSIDPPKASSRFPSAVPSRRASSNSIAGTKMPDATNTPAKNANVCRTLRSRPGSRPRLATATSKHICKPRNAKMTAAARAMPATNSRDPCAIASYVSCGNAKSPTMSMATCASAAAPAAAHKNSGTSIRKPGRIRRSFSSQKHRPSRSAS